MAVEKGNYEIVKLLLNDDNIDVNMQNIFKSILFSVFIIEYLNYIQFEIFKWYFE